MAALLNKVVPAELLDEPIFYPQYETELKVRGYWLRVTKPLFAGYLMVVTKEPLAVEASLARIPEFARVLRMGEVPAPLAPEEVQLIGGMTHPGARVVPMSSAQKVGDRVVIVDGPLLGHEGLIKEINRRKSTAYLEIDLCGRKVRTRVGVAVLSAPNAPAARTAALHAKASADDFERRALRRRSAVVAASASHSSV